MIPFLPYNPNCNGCETSSGGGSSSSVSLIPYEVNWEFGDDKSFISPYTISKLIMFTVNGIEYPNSSVGYTIGGNIFLVDDEIFPTEDPGVIWRFKFVFLSSGSSSGGDSEDDGIFTLEFNDVYS